MTQLLIRRAIQLVLVLIGISTLLFLLLRLSGDPAALLAGPQATLEQVEAWRVRLGLDQTLWHQYVSFMGDIFRLDFGNSYTYRQPALTTVLSRLPASGVLTGSSVVFALVLGIGFGTLAARHRGTPVATTILAANLVGQSVPNFVLGIGLIALFGVHLGWFPTFGSGTILSLVLPTITLGGFMAARQIRLVRSLVLGEMNKDYVRVVRAGGLSERRVFYRHIVRNVLAPVIGVAGIDIGLMFGGAIVTETIFAWPGLGRLMVGAVLDRDYPVVQASVFTIAVLVFVVNFLIDLLYRVVDPTIRKGGADVA